MYVEKNTGGSFHIITHNYIIHTYTHTNTHTHTYIYIYIYVNAHTQIIPEP